MKRLHDKELLQIELAELQADLQMDLTMGLGFFGIFIATAVAFWQTAASASNQDLQRFLIICVVALGFGAFLGESYILGRMKATI